MFRSMKVWLHVGQGLLVYSKQELHTFENQHIKMGKAKLHKAVKWTFS